jgi:hypothetical protein
MMKPSTVVLAFALTAVGAIVAPAAQAAVCVQLDTAHDNLSEQERAGTMTMFVQTLQQQGQQVVTEGCQGTYVVYHVRLGYSVNVVVSGPGGSRQATARAIEEVPAVYSQIVHSLLTGQPMNTANMTVDRTNVTAAQQAPNRVEADSLWYARLGYTGISGPSFSSGPSFGFGYRYELDSVGIDFSFLNFAFAGSDSTNHSSNVTGSFIRLQGLYFLNPISNGSMYVGAGAAWGITAGEKDDGAGGFSVLSGNGLQGELTAGYEFLRASTIRLFVQADATLPFYKITNTVASPGGLINESAWAPSFGVSLGVGWGRSLTRIHVVP